MAALDRCLVADCALTSDENDGFRLGPLVERRTAVKRRRFHSSGSRLVVDVCAWIQLQTRAPPRVRERARRIVKCVDFDPTTNAVLLPASSDSPAWPADLAQPANIDSALGRLVRWQRQCGSSDAAAEPEIFQAQPGPWSGRAFRRFLASSLRGSRYERRSVGRRRAHPGGGRRQLARRASLRRPLSHRPHRSSEGRRERGIVGHRWGWGGLGRPRDLDVDLGESFLPGRERCAGARRGHESRRQRAGARQHQCS